MPRIASTDPAPSQPTPRPVPRRLRPPALRPTRCRQIPAADPDPRNAHDTGQRPTPMTAPAPTSRRDAASTGRRDFAPLLRALLRRRMAGAAGRGRGDCANPFRRLAAAVLDGGRRAARVRPDQPVHSPATNTMPFGPVRLAALGLGLAGGGGGSPGRPRPPAPPARPLPPRASRQAPPPPGLALRKPPSFPRGQPPAPRPA